MIVIEITAAIDPAGTLKTFYASDEAYATKPTDTPGDTAFIPSIKNPLTLGVSVFGDGQVAGATKLEVGEIVLSNANAQYDPWLNYGFGGRNVVIRQGTKGTSYPASFVTLFTGTVDNIYADRKELRIRLKDRQNLFEKPVLTTAYAGNNSLPNGAEGSTDIKGRVKPRVYGSAPGVSPVMVNTSKLTYQVSDVAVASIVAYDRGTTLTLNGDTANLAALEAASPGAGTYTTCLALGLFRLGGAPAGTVTADVVQGANAAARTVAQVLKLLALAAGVSAGDIDAASVTALDTANASVVGISLADEISYLEAMDKVARSVGAYFGFDPDGKFVMGVWSAPSGTSVVTISEFYAGVDTERRPLKDVDVPVYLVKVNHSKQWTVLTDLAGSVSAVRRATVGQEYRTEPAIDLGILTQFLDAQVFEVDTLLTNVTDAATEAARLLAMLKTRRDAFEVPVPVSLLATPGLKLGACVTLQINRFGLSGGKLMRVQRIRYELARNRAWLTVWG